MAIQSLDLGTSADDGTGDSLRVGGDKINDNFLELYTLLGNGSILTTGLSVSGATITLSEAVGTFTTITPNSADSASLGTAALGWSDLYLYDSSVIYFGIDSDITLTHVPDVGLRLKSAATADDKPIVLTLQTGETDIAASDVLGKIEFQAPDEGTGTDAILVAAHIAAISEGNFSASNNATKLSFATGASEAAAEKMSLSSAGLLTVSGRIITDDTTAATSTTDGSLQTDGGLSVAADAVIGDDLLLLSDAAVLSFGANSEVTLTHVHNDGLLLNTDMQLQFRDSAINIRSDADGDLDINADDEIELNSTLIDINGNVQISGTLAQADAITMATNKKIVFRDAAIHISSTADGDLAIAADDEIDLTSTLIDVNGNLDVSGTYTGAGVMTTGGNIVIPDGGNIGSASDTNAMSISSIGLVSLSATNAIKLNVGTTAQRPTGAAGLIRYNSTTSGFEGYGAAWGALGGGATGGGGDTVFIENQDDVTTNYSITAGSNALSVGPIIVETGVTVTIPTGNRWLIL